jgi:glycine/D-amino acid oxidase-like deaminating enzyme
MAEILADGPDLAKRWNVLVVGGGNAALCAAISARREGASVLVVEAAPKFYRGGNTRHTRNMRCAHDRATEILTGPYTEDEFLDDLLRVSRRSADPPDYKIAMVRTWGGKSSSCREIPQRGRIESRVAFDATWLRTRESVIRHLRRV